MNASGFGGRNIGGLTVQQEVGERGPHERGTNVRHLGEFLLAKRHPVYQDQFSHQEIVLHKNVKFTAASLVHAFCDMDEPRVEFAAGVACLDVVAHIVRRQFGDLGVNFIPAEVVVFDVPRQDGGVAVFGVAGAALCSGCSTHEGFHFDVLHRLRFHVPIRPRVNQHLRFGNLFAVVRVVFPFVAVVVAAPLVSVVLGEVRGHVPQGRLVVVQVIVKVEQARINRAVGFQHGHVGQLDVGRDFVFPDSLDHPVLHQNVAFVDDVSLAGHGHNSAFQHVGAFMDVVVQSVAAHHVLGHGVGFPVAPARCGRVDFGNRTVEGLDVGGVPPRVLSGIGERVDEVARTVRDGRRVAVPIIQFNSRTLSEDDDVSVGLDGGVPRETTGARATFGDVVKQPVGDINRLVTGVPQFDELVGG